MNLDGRLRAASKALRDGSGAQVDAASSLREIVHAGRLLAADPTSAPPDPPAPPPPGRPLVRRTQRVALVINLLLVLVLGAAIVAVAVGRGRDAPAVSAPAPTVATSRTPPSTVVTRTVVKVPPECIDASELADEIISKLNRNQRDNALALALRDWSVANNQCRREATAAEAAGG
jgi:hypothetical protein